MASAQYLDAAARQQIDAAVRDFMALAESWSEQRAAQVLAQLNQVAHRLSAADWSPLVAKALRSQRQGELAVQAYARMLELPCAAADAESHVTLARLLAGVCLATGEKTEEQLLTGFSAMLRLLERYPPGSCDKLWLTAAGFLAIVSTPDLTAPRPLPLCLQRLAPRVLEVAGGWLFAPQSGAVCWASATLFAAVLLDDRFLSAAAKCASPLQHQLLLTSLLRRCVASLAWHAAYAGNTPPGTRPSMNVDAVWSAHHHRYLVSRVAHMLLQALSVSPLPPLLLRGATRALCAMLQTHAFCPYTSRVFPRIVEELAMTLLFCVQRPDARKCLPLQLIGLRTLLQFMERRRLLPQPACFHENMVANHWSGYFTLKSPPAEECAAFEGALRACRALEQTESLLAAAVRGGHIPARAPLHISHDSMHFTIVDTVIGLQGAAAHCALRALPGDSPANRDKLAGVHAVASRLDAMLQRGEHDVAELLSISAALRQLGVAS